MSPSDQTVPEISVVVPAYNEAGNVVPLAREIAAALDGRSFEILFVDDCSKDATRQELIDAKAELPMLRVIAHRHNAGQSRSVRTGVMQARGAIICTLDGDGQNPPQDLPTVIDALTRDDAPENLALVGGDRSANRQDSAWKKFASRFGNGLRKAMLNDNCNDTGCGLKAFRRSAYLALPFFDHQHRFLPALMIREGYVCEFRPVTHRHRMIGTSKYTNFGRLFASLTDMMGVMWLNSRARNSRGSDEF
ncbi:glycosyltransferase family 2 protein [Maricaulis maris]|uniref:Glycosyltransferase involved in cell wall biosynthesis n=1 Tax=Maricaulis maris TaxID=74318 RepID=A0A495CY27_9PROT|nr:glycosyltransferase family 2 protein [Maricaulis maris]RKQ94212.1 glycosyltransferase involved in cell wall biosynthesis [Maricaulis maris]